MRTTNASKTSRPIHALDPFTFSTKSYQSHLVRVYAAVISRHSHLRLTDDMTKLIVIIGITGNQGGSVARTFLNDPSWRIRGLTRDTQSSASLALSAQGIEMVRADLHDPSSLKDVFKGANLVFSVTDFWKPYFDPSNRARAAAQGKSIGQYAYELELEQGKNVVDAVAREVDGLDDVGLIASTLCNARQTSGGKYKELWHFDGKADVFPAYLKEKYPELAKKTSYLHTGYFFTSWQILPGRWFAKVSQACSHVSRKVERNTTISMTIPGTRSGCERLAGSPYLYPRCGASWDYD